MPPRKRKPARNDRPKTIAIAILGLVLVAVMLWPAEESVDSTAQAGAGQHLAPAANGLGATGSATNELNEDAGNTSTAPATAGDASGQPIVELPRIGSDAIAAIDPFSVGLGRNEATEGSAGETPTAFAATSSRVPVRAVYRTSRGAVAIVDDEIIPVKQAKQWIAHMRDAHPEP